MLLRHVETRFDALLFVLDKPRCGRVDLSCLTVTDFAEFHVLSTLNRKMSTTVL